MPGALALAERRSPSLDLHMEIFSRTLAIFNFFHIFPKIAYFRGFSRIIWRFLLDSCEFLLENLKNFFYNVKKERNFPKIRKKCKKLSETLQFFIKFTNFSRKNYKKMEKFVKIFLAYERFFVMEIDKQVLVPPPPLHNF